MMFSKKHVEAMISRIVKEEVDRALAVSNKRRKEFKNNFAQVFTEADATPAPAPSTTPDPTAPAGQTVSVRLSQSPEVFGGTPTAPGITLVVQDSGIGIPKEQHHRVFEKMFRADNARHAEAVGTGLGLYTIKIAVETLGGKIWFESQENIGTTFYVYLPTTDASMPEKGV
jgi:signal transduction histidine kinase